MSGTFKEWLSSTVRLEGLFGSGIVFSAGCFVHSNSPDLPDESLQALCSGIGELVRSLSAEYPAASRLRWVFEESYCYAILRPDGACLVLLTAKETHKPDYLVQLAEQFRAL